MQQAIATRTADALQGGKFLTFSLADVTYGLPIHCVQEIIGMQPVVQVPRLPHHMRGVINLRGRVVAALDLRRKFGLPDAEETRNTCIIVVDVPHSDGHTTSMGLVVDSVSEVLDIDAAEMAPADGVAEGGTAPVQGFGVEGDHVRLLLDLERVLSRDEATAATAAARQQQQMQQEPPQPEQHVQAEEAAQQPQQP